MFCKISNSELFNKDPRTPAWELIPNKATDQKDCNLTKMNSHRDELPRTLPKFAIKNISKFSRFNLLSRKISSWLLPDNFDIKNYKSHKTAVNSFSIKI